MMFFISLLMVFVSSYFMACVFSPKDEANTPKSVYPFLYLLLIMFAQVILTMESLSLFSAIKENNVLFMNVLFLVLSMVLWFKNSKPLYIPRIKETYSRILKGLKRDKVLMIMAFGFVFFILTVIILDAFLPVNGADALTYHLNRASYWMFQGNLNHFTISDDRNLVMPINSEILYLWNILFFKNDIGLYFISFIGYIGVIFSIYNILQYFGFSERRKLWSIFILSSFASVMAQVSSLETDVLIAGIILASITLFLYALKDKNHSVIYFSSLAYAIAMGTKSPAVIAFPGVFLLMAYFAYKDLKKECYKPLVSFLAFLFINFMIFSSYNYILNFIDYKSFLGSESARAVHGFTGGYKAFIANYIRYIFMMFDFSGFKYSEYVGDQIINAKLAIFNFLHIPEDLGVSMSDNNIINNRFLNVKVGTGLLGFLVFMPAAITSIILGFFRKNSKKIMAMQAFGFMFFINVGVMSGILAYMVFSVRFLTFLVLLSCPVLALSYIRKTNIIKLLLLFFVMSYFLIMSVNLSGRQYGEIAKLILKTPTLNYARETLRCALYTGYEGRRPFCYIRDYIHTDIPKGSKIGVFADASDSSYLINMLNAYGYKIITLLPEKAPTYNLNDFDYLITTNKVLTSTVLLTDTKNTEIKYLIDKYGRAYYPKYQPFSCVYEDVDKEFHYKDRDNIIMDSRCFIDDPFFEKRNFVLIKAFDFQSEMREYTRYVSVYKNKKKS